MQQQHCSGEPICLTKSTKRHCSSGGSSSSSSNSVQCNAHNCTQQHYAGVVGSCCQEKTLVAAAQAVSHVAC
jgi:hypothetical protein